MRDAGFLGAYAAEAAGDTSSAVEFRAAVREWERAGPPLPLSQLGLDELALRLLFTVGLVEEDARFGLVWEAVDGGPGQQRPTRACSPRGRTTAPRAPRSATLVRLGLVESGNAADPRRRVGAAVAPLVWDAARGELPRQPAPWLRYEPPEDATRSTGSCLNDGEAAAVALAPAALAARRGRRRSSRAARQSSGRRTAARARSRASSAAASSPSTRPPSRTSRWRAVGPLATLLHALPVCVLDLAPGASAELRGLPAYDGPARRRRRPAGRPRGRRRPRAPSCSTLGLPGPAARARHWRDALGPAARRGARRRRG